MKNFLDYATDGLGAHVRAHNGLPYLEKNSVLGERLAGQVLAQRQITSSADSGRRLLCDVFSYHRKMHFLSEFMPKVDGGTMHYAVEARSPLLDHEIWDFAATLSPEARFHGGVLKAVLREIVRRRVSPKVADRRKQGFTVPVDQHLTSDSSKVTVSKELEQLRDASQLEQGGWVRPGSLRGMVEDADRRRSVSPQLWHLLVLENWLKHKPAQVQVDETVRVK
jgi:asparagine synthase (glutamine-hydrolysing)